MEISIILNLNLPIQFEFEAKAEKIFPEIAEVVRIFAPNAILSFDTQTQNTLLLYCEVCSSKLVCNADFCGQNFSLSCDMTKLNLKRQLKLTAYWCLKNHFGISPPWGALTGIRPTKLAQELYENNSLDDLIDVYDVTREKFDLAIKIMQNQKDYRTNPGDTIDFYIGIPFCLSKCTYCSFSSGEIGKLKHLVLPFVEALKEEIKLANSIIRLNNHKVGNIYIGGGTPTTLDMPQLEQILSILPKPLHELTVEIGRADTVTEDKLRLLNDFSVSRVSLNPQTFDDSTLKAINRTHTASEFIEKYQLVKKYDWLINMDLIAGLPNEDFAVFEKSLLQAFKLEPHNLTVHTLALKAGSLLKEISKVENNQQQVSAMVAIAKEKALEKGYQPYYLYRQKYVSGNLENVGYCKKDTQCRYNINIMEELSSVIACGCNAISKRIYSSTNRIERQANPKDVITYINDLQRFLQKKKELFD